MTKSAIRIGLAVLMLGLALAACGPAGDEGQAIDPPRSCGEDAILEYNCWVDEFPDTPGRVDVRCSFATLCCQETVQSWEFLYEKAAGPRGVADEGDVPTDVGCQDGDRLPDLDGDGLLNVRDPDPTNTGDWQWE